MTDNKLINALINSFFPQRCPYCNSVIKKNEIACENCIKEFPSNGFSCYARGGYKCVCAFLYDGIFSTAIKNMKFHNKPQYAPLLAEVLAKEITKQYSGSHFDFVTCVPLHKLSKKKRGYNQSELLARNIAKILNTQYCDILIKTKENAKQHTLSRNLRAKNVKNAYTVIPQMKEEIKGKQILICDDIITTGNTLGECANTITKYAPAQVCCTAVCLVAQR